MLIFDYSEFSKSPKFLHSYSSQESAETHKYSGDFAKLRVIERNAYNFKTLKLTPFFRQRYARKVSIKDWARWGRHRDSSFFTIKIDDMTPERYIKQKWIGIYFDFW